MVDEENCFIDLLKEEEVEDAYHLYKDRVKWMEKKRISLWDETDYLGVYNLAYFRKKAKEGSFYALWLRSGKQVLALTVILKEDPRWETDGTKSIYIHNLVSDPEAPGAGTLFLDLLEERFKGEYEFSRFDYAIDSSYLISFYEKRGYKPSGYC